MSTFFNDIQAAFDKRLDALTGDVPIAWPNIQYDPVTGTEYYKPTFLPSDSDQFTLGSAGKDQTTGIYQIDIFVPAGSGRTAKSDTLADHFKRGTILSENTTRVRIKSASIGVGRNEPDWHIVPISISWETITEART